MSCLRWACRRSRAASAIRFSLGKETTASEIEQTVEAIERILRRRKFTGQPRTRRNMLSFSQLEFSLAPSVVEKPPGRDSALEALARDLLLQQGATTLAAQVRVEWSARLRTAAGRAECGARTRSAQPPSQPLTARLRLTGLFAMSWRTSLRNFVPAAVALRPMGWNGGGPAPIWGLSGEARCHNLPFPLRRQRRRYLYACPHCQRDFPRIRPLRRTSACLACCRAFNRGRYDRALQAPARQALGAASPFDDPLAKTSDASMARG